MNIENPVLCMKTELEQLQNTLTEENFLKHIQNYFSEEITNLNQEHLITKFWGNIWTPFHQLSPLLDKITDPSSKSTWGNHISVLGRKLKSIETFTRSQPNINLKENSTGVSQARQDLQNAISSTVNLMLLGSLAVSNWENYKKFSNICLDKINDFKNEILNSILNDDLKDKLIDLLDEMEKLLREDFINESKFKEESTNTYIYLDYEKDNPKNAKDECNYLSTLFIKFKKLFFPSGKFLLDKSASPLITFGIEGLKQLSSGN